MEIERKFLIPELPMDLESYPSYEIEQAYLCKNPTIRVRRNGDRYTMTYKSGGMMVHEEFEKLPLTQEAFEKLRDKADGKVIIKQRYLIPYKDGLTIELDIFSGEFAGLWMAEVEFPDVVTAETFQPPEWFGVEVTYDPKYHNVNMSLPD